MATASATMGELFSALAEAQGKMEAPSKNREVTVKLRDNGGSYKFKYATLDGIIENTLRPVLPGVGLWFVQRVEDGQIVTRITHKSGEYMDAGHIPFPNLPNKPQEAGSIITYFKRYSLCQAFGIMADEDDDANVAEGNGYEPAPARKQEPAHINAQQLAKIQAEVDRTGTDVAALCNAYHVKALAELNAGQFADAMSVLRKRPAKITKEQSEAELGDSVPA